MAEEHLAIYQKLEEMQGTLNSIEEASDLEPVLNDISITLKDIYEKMDALVFAVEKIATKQ